MDALLLDIRYGIRQLLRQRGTSFVVRAPSIIVPAAQPAGEHCRRSEAQGPQCRGQEESRHDTGGGRAENYTRVCVDTDL
jgi:hypothetical protein